MDEKEKIYADGTDEENFAEKRQTDRKKLIVDVHFEGGDATGIANTRNISLGGLFMKTNTLFDEGTELLLRLTIGGRKLVLNGIVSYLEEGNGVGISFQDLSPEIEEIIQREIEEE